MTKNRTRDGRLTLALTAALTVALAATGTTQKQPAKKQTEATLAQAVVAEIYEHNLGKAMDMYRTIAGDAKRTGDTRTQARLRLAKAYRRLGQNIQAEATLRKAAAGKGPAAKEAASILSGQAQDDGDLVKVKVEQALLAMRLTGKPDKTDLTWIGRPAVPYIIKAVDAEKADLRFITNAARVLFQLGGPQVLKWIDDTRKSADVLRKRAVIKGFAIGDEAVCARLAGFLADKDVTVRREVMTYGSRFLDSSALLSTLDDPDAQVRQRAFQLLRSGWRAIEHDVSEFDTFVRLMPKLEKEEADFRSSFGLQNGSMASWLAGEPVAMRAAATTAHNRSVESFPGTEQGRKTLLRAAAFRCFRNCYLRWPMLTENPGGNAYSAEIAAAARKIGNVGDRGGNQNPDAYGNTRTIATVLRNVMQYWSRDAMPTVLALVELGYDSRGRLSTWVVQHGTAEDLDAVVARLHQFDENRGIELVCNWMTKVGAPSEILGSMKELAERFEAANQTRSSRFQAVLKTILSIDSKEAIDYLVKKIVESGDDYKNCMTNKPDVARERSVLQRLLVLPGKDERSSMLRGWAFHMLLRNHANPGEPALFARVYEIGFPDSGPCADPAQNRSSRQPRGVFYTYNGSGNWQVRCTEERRAKILAACLATGEAEAFKDLAVALPWGTSQRIAEAICRNMLHCPELETAQGEDARGAMFRRAMTNLARGEAGAQLAIDGLTHASPAVRRVAIQNLGPSLRATPDLARQVMQRLGDKDVMVRRFAAQFLANSDVEIEDLVPAMTARLEDSDSRTVVNAIEFHRRNDPDTLLRQMDRLLGHPNVDVRYQAAFALLGKHGAKVVDKIGPLLVDDAMEVGRKNRLVIQLGGLMDLRVVPHLIQALKSPALRKAAQEQLKAIRFYHEESSKWSRVMKGAGFTQTTAAEALIAQAKAGKKAVRLAAIASLGTLAEPETLPFLVKLIGDEDAELAAAAEDAVNRINKAGKK